MFKKLIFRLARMILRVIWRLHAPVLWKNVRYKNIHAGQTCLIFGNGSSLKFYDFTVLPKIPAICCNFSPLDNRFASIDLKYWVLAETYGFYKRYFDLASMSLKKNFTMTSGRSLFVKNKDKTIFTSITNYYGSKKDLGNFVYFHDFGDKTSLSADLAKKFTICHGSIHAMLGVAKYMGFKKAILLGCDYLGYPKMEGHFYADSKPEFGEIDSGYIERTQAVVKYLDIEVLAVFPKGIKSPYFESVCFEEYFGGKEKYHENHEFIDADYLALMRQATKHNQVYM